MWKKKEMTPDEQARQAHEDAQRRNIESTYRCGARTGSRKKLKPAPVKLTVMPGYSMEEALKGTGGDADE